MKDVELLRGIDGDQARYAVRGVNSDGSDSKIYYPVYVDNNKATPEVASVVKSALEDARNNLKQNPALWEGSQNQMFQQVADNVVNTNYFNAQVKSIDQVDFNNGSITKYGPTQSYADQEAYNDAQAQSIGEPIYNDSYTTTGPIAEIKSKSQISSVKGITVDPRTRVLDGNRINPYTNPARETTVIAQEDTIGGADLSVYIMMQVPNVADLGKPKDLQRKEIIIEELDSALSLSYSTVRETFPVRKLGHINAVGYTKGPRTVAGHIAFAIFTRDILSQLRVRIKNEIDGIDKRFKDFKANSESSLQDAKDKYKGWLEQRYYLRKLAESDPSIQLLDQLGPFHLLVMGMNEAGTFSKLVIRDVTIVDENQYQGTEQPHIINKVSWVAQDIVPMHTLTNENTVIISSANSITESYSGGKYNGNINYNYEVTGTTLMKELANDLDKESK